MSKPVTNSTTPQGPPPQGPPPQGMNSTSGMNPPQGMNSTSGMNPPPPQSSSSYAPGSNWLGALIG